LQGVESLSRRQKARRAAWLLKEVRWQRDRHAARLRHAVIHLYYRQQGLGTTKVAMEANSLTMAL